MSVLKTTAVFGAIGGIGFIGYYLLRKSKPTLSDQQLKELSEFYILNDETEEKRKDLVKIAKYGIYKKISDYDITFLQRILNDTPLELSSKEYVFLIQSLKAFQRKGAPFLPEDRKIKSLKLEKEFRKKGSSIVSSNTENWDSEYSFYKPNKARSYELINMDYPIFFDALPNSDGKNIKVKAKNCFDLDEKIKSINDSIAYISKNSSLNNKRDVFMWWKEILEDYSVFRGCRNKIEEQRLLDMGTAQTISAIKSERSVLGGNEKELDRYFFGGAIVLVISAVILLNANE